MEAGRPLWLWNQTVSLLQFVEKKSRITKKIIMPVFVPSKKIGKASRWNLPSRFINSGAIVSTRNVGLLLYAKAYMWFHKIADFRQAEMALLYEQRPTKSLRSQHRQIMEILIEEGNELIRRIHASGGLIRAENGFSAADIQSAVDDLRNTLLQWYGGMTRKRKEEILQSVFNASE